MRILTAILGIGAVIGSILGFAIAIAATIALGPLFWLPYLLIYLLLRASGLTPKQLRKKREVVKVPSVGFVDPKLFEPIPYTPPTDHAPFLAHLPDLPNPDRIEYTVTNGRLHRSVFDSGEPPTRSSLD